MNYSAGFFAIVFALFLTACAGPGSTVSGSSSSSSSTTSSSSSSSNSSSGLIVTELGELECNDSISENWPCSFYSRGANRNEFLDYPYLFSTCDYVECATFTLPRDYSPIMGRPTCQVSFPQYHQCWWARDDSKGGCGSGQCGSEGSGLSTFDPYTPLNIAVNGDVEAGITPWVVVGNAEIVQSNVRTESGNHSLYVSNRRQTSDGAGLHVAGLKPGHVHEVTSAIWLESDSTASDLIEIGAAFGTDHKVSLGTRKITPNTWTYISFKYKHLSSANLDPVLYFRGPKAGNNIYVDNFYVSALPRRKTELKAIEDGKVNYINKGCINCHGTGLNDLQAAQPLDPFNLNKTTRSALARYIHFNMPANAPGECSGRCAISVAAYMLSWEW